MAQLRIMTDPNHKEADIRKKLNLNPNVVTVMGRAATIMAWPYWNETVTGLRTDWTFFNYMNAIIQMTGGDARVLYVLFALTLWRVRYGDFRQQKFYIRKVRHLYATLAGRLNSAQLVEDLRTGIFRAEHPEEFKDIIRQISQILDISEEVNQAIAERQDIDYAVDVLQERFKEIAKDMRAKIEHALKGIKGAKIYVDLKSPDSIYQKIKHKARGYTEFGQLRDVLRVMVILENMDDAWRAKALISSLRSFDVRQEEVKNEIRHGFNYFQIDLNYDGRKWEIQVMDQDNYLKYRFGFQSKHALTASGVSKAHWAYKASEALRHDGIKGQKLPGDELELGVDIAENLLLIFQRINERMHILLLHPRKKGGESFAVITLPYNATPFDAAMHRKIRLDKSYRGFVLTEGNDPYVLKQWGRFPRGRKDILSHHSSLRAGIVLEESTQGPPIDVQKNINQRLNLQDKVQSLRARLMLRAYLQNPGKYNAAVERGKALLTGIIEELGFGPFPEDTFIFIARFNEEHRLAQNDGNFRFNELCAALAMNLIEPSQLRAFMQSQR